MIRFHVEEILPPKIKKQKIRNWIRKVIICEGKNVGGLNIIFCSDDYLLNINKEYLKHNYYTDVITFDYTKKNRINGDVFLSVDRIEDNAKQLKINFLSELNRIILHGVLHLIGYNDKASQEKLQMTNKENYYLKLINDERFTEI